MKVRFVTLGCKVNQYETQAMRESLLRAGVQEEGEGPNDFVVINTCTVTDGADRENRYWIRRLRRENPQAKIVVTGCWVERNRRDVESLPGVDLVLSNREKGEISERLLQGCAIQDENGRGGFETRPYNGVRYDRLQISSFQGHARAFVKIQDGCNHACSFCKVVLVRGRSRSRPLPEIVAEAKRLSDSGYREMVLTGIQLGAYGADLEPKSNLISVIEALSEVAGIERIRLSSIEPTDVKPELIQAMKENSKVCPQLHIPLQSGDDEILQQMNRRYRKNFYRDLIARLREEIPDFCLSMDVMAGFPGETEPHFQNTLSLIEETRPIRVHAFPYSRRPGTRAVRLEDLPPATVRDRMNRLGFFTEGVTRREKEKFVGRSFSVLVEKKSSRGELYQGHTAHYLKVYFQASSESLSESVRVRLAAVAGDGFLGTREGGAVG